MSQPLAPILLPSGHTLHFMPLTPGLHEHSPDICSQSSRTEPTPSQLHADEEREGERERERERDGRQPYLLEQFWLDSLSLSLQFHSDKNIHTFAKCMQAIWSCSNLWPHSYSNSACSVSMTAAWWSSKRGQEALGWERTWLQNVLMPRGPLGQSTNCFNHACFSMLGFVAAYKHTNPCVRALLVCRQNL